MERDSKACDKEFAAFWSGMKYLGPGMLTSSLGGPLKNMQPSVNMLQFPLNHSWQ